LGGFLLFLALAVAGGGREAVHEAAPGIMRYTSTDHATFLPSFFLLSFRRIKMQALPSTLLRVISGRDKL
jgi:hypothetical protein